MKTIILGSFISIKYLITVKMGIRRSITYIVLGGGKITSFHLVSKHFFFSRNGEVVVNVF